MKNSSDIRDVLFSPKEIEQSAFEKSMLIGVGRDLKLPQAVAQSQCRLYASKQLTMLHDGFEIDFCLECLIGWIVEGAKTNSDLTWHLHERCRDTQEMFTFG